METYKNGSLEYHIPTRYPVTLSTKQVLLLSLQKFNSEANPYSRRFQTCTGSRTAFVAKYNEEKDGKVNNIPQRRTTKEDHITDDATQFQEDKQEIQRPLADLDKKFTGSYTVNTESLVEPAWDVCIRPVDESHVKALEREFKKAPLNDFMSMVGRIRGVPPDDFKSEDVRKYKIEVIGGSHSLRAIRNILKDPDCGNIHHLFKRREIKLYLNLTSDEAKCVAFQHNKVHKFALPMTLEDTLIKMRQSLFIKDGSFDADDVKTKEPPRDKCVIQHWKDGLTVSEGCFCRRKLNNKYAMHMRFAQSSKKTWTLLMEVFGKWRRKELGGMPKGVLKEKTPRLSPFYIKCLDGLDEKTQQKEMSSLIKGIISYNDFRTRLESMKRPSKQIDDKHGFPLSETSEEIALGTSTCSDLDTSDGSARQTSTAEESDGSIYIYDDSEALEPPAEENKDVHNKDVHTPSKKRIQELEKEVEEMKLKIKDLEKERDYLKKTLKENDEKASNIIGTTISADIDTTISNDVPDDMEQQHGGLSLLFREPNYDPLNPGPGQELLIENSDLLPKIVRTSKKDRRLSTKTTNRNAQKDIPGGKLAGKANKVPKRKAGGNGEEPVPQKNKQKVQGDIVAAEWSAGDVYLGVLTNEGGKWCRAVYPLERSRITNT